MNKHEARIFGFSQRKPEAPGIYFILDPPPRLDPPGRMIEGWDICEIRWNTRQTDLGENTPHGIWYIHTLSGLNYRWQKGTWLKGPIHPKTETKKGSL